MPRAVVLLSGGADSTVLLADLASQGFHVHPLFINYGQKSVEHERRASRSVVRWCRHKYQGRCAALTERRLFLGDVAPSRVTGRSATRRSRIYVNNVPARNGYLLLAGAAFALEVRAVAVAVGFHKWYGGYDSVDQSPAFVQAMQRVLREAFVGGKYPDILVPYARLPKDKVVQRGVKLGVRLDQVWTCYTRATKPCGVCPSCYCLSRAMRDVKVASGY